MAVGVVGQWLACFSRWFGRLLAKHLQKNNKTSLGLGGSGSGFWLGPFRFFYCSRHVHVQDTDPAKPLAADEDDAAPRLNSGVGILLRLENSAVLNPEALNLENN